jgi:hypothetical protein
MSTLAVATGATTTFNTMNTVAIERAIDQVQVLDFPIEIFSLVQQEATELTRAFIKFCRSVYTAKLTSDRKEWREGKESLAWDKSTANPYSKVGEWLVSIDPYNLELLDINTIKSLCCEKFKAVLDRLESERLTVVEVREEMKAINEATKKPKQPKPQIEWKTTPEGERKLTVNDIDADTGDLLESRFKNSGESVLSFFLRRLLEGKASQPIVQIEKPVPVQVEEIIKPADPLYRVRVLGDEDYEWCYNCKLVKSPEPPINNWYVFISEEGIKLKVVGEDEFASMDSISIGAKVRIVSNNPHAGCCGEIVGENGNLWKVLLDKDKQLEDTELHILVHVSKELVELA